jgi:hypothetical protein
MRCFQSSMAGAEGHVLYTFGFDSNFAVPRLLLDGDVTDVQAYLQQVQRLMEGQKTWAQKEGQATVVARLEAGLRAESEERVRAAEVRARRAEAEMAGLQERLAAARADEGEVRARIEAPWRERLTEVREECGQMIGLLREQLEAGRTESRGLMERIAARDMTLRSSQGRGRLGEDAFAEAATSAVGWQLERSAGEARACDFKMRYGGFDVRFEIKNHATPIPGADVQKFYRDMEEHRECTGVGIFVALNVALTATKGRLLHHEWKEDSGQLLIFISAFNEADPDFVFMVLRHLIEVYSRYRTLRDRGALDDGLRQLEELKGRMDSAMIHVSSMGTHLKEMRLKLARDKKSVLKMYDDTLELAKSLQAEYDMTLGLLLGTAKQNEQQNDVVEEAVVETVVPKKRSGGKKKATDN